MALARSCDICGAFYHPYHLDENNEIDRENFTCIGFYNLDERYGPCTGRHEGREYYDLCPCCHDNLIHFISDLRKDAEIVKPMPKEKQEEIEVYDNKENDNS